jgi:ketosteroid isomerase-like protein
MKTLLKDLAMILLVLVLGITGCAAPATQPPPTQTPVPAVNPLSETVLKMVGRLNAGDLEGSLDYFADDSVTYFVGMPPTGMEIYRGKEGIRPVWEECIGSHFKMEVEIVSVVGDVVNARSKTWHDFTRQLGVAPNEFIETYVIKDGKIAVYSSTLTVEALAKFKPALAAVMPPEPTAVPSTDTPVSEINVTISENTCSYEGSMVLQTGPIKVNVDATSEDKKISGLTFFTLDPGKDLVDLMAATPLPYPPSWAKMLTLWEMSPGTSETNTLTVAEGPLYLVCWSKTPDLAIGNIGPFTTDVTLPSSSLPEGPVSDMTVVISKGRCIYEGSMILQAGEVAVTMDVKDKDKESYALSFFTLDSGKTFDDLMASAGGSAPAPPPWAHMFSFHDMGPNQSETYAITVETGPVYLICWGPDKPIGKFGPFEVK